MGGLSIASESWSFHWVYSPPTGYSFGHPWHLVSISSSQCYQVILSDMPISLKIVCLKFTSCRVLCINPHVSVLLWSLHHLPLFRVNWWRIYQCLPLVDFILSTSVHHPRMKSRNLSVLWYLGGHFHYRWFSSRLLVICIIDHQSVDFPHVRLQNHLFTWDKMYRFDGIEDPGILGDFTVITSPPRLQLELCIFDTYVYYIIDP